MAVIQKAGNKTLSCINIGRKRSAMIYALLTSSGISNLNESGSPFSEGTIDAKSEGSDVCQAKGNKNSFIARMIWHRHR